jgi:glycerophosphoryl diester phosphodiesterase
VIMVNRVAVRAVVGSLVAAATVAGALVVATGVARAGTILPFMVGHRGGAGGAYVENTMRAFAAGAKVGAWLEADIRFTRDDLPVVLHDATIDRTTSGRGPVTRYTYAQLRAFKTDDGQVIPSFAQFAKFLKRANKKAFIELKTQPANARQWAHLESLAKPVQGLVVVYSQTPAYLAAARAHGFKTALYERAKRATPAQIKKEGDFYFRQYASVSASEMAALARHKVRVVLFTPASAKGWQKSKQLGAWGILTDHGATYAKWRG